MNKEKNNQAYQELLNWDNPEDLETNSLLENLSLLIDISLDSGKIEGTQKAIDIIDKLDLNTFSSKERALLYYFRANAWKNKFDLNQKSQSQNRKKTIWEWEPDELKKVIINLRLSIIEKDFNEINDIYKCNVFTNLANVFDTLGKFIEALEFWDRAIEINPNFGMALGNKGIGLIYYATFIYDPGHEGIFVRSARQFLQSSIRTLRNYKEYSQAIEDFNKHLSHIEKLIPEPKNHTCLNKNYSLGKTRSEKRYRKWCLENRLFLNPLNDLGTFSIAAQDIITTPNMITPLDVGPRYQGFFNQIKQEFVSCRFLCYEGIKFPKTHYSDKKVLLYNTYDYPSYGISVEKVKIAFRIAYSLLDKIAYFLNEYLDLKIDKNYIYFRNIWFIDNKNIREKIKTKNNAPLRGLYWLSKDLFEKNEKDKSFYESLEPESKHLHEIRNHLEHKYLKIHEYPFKPYHNKLEKGLFDDLAYSIPRQDFNKKTIRLLKLVRNAIIYLSLSIYKEEMEHEINSDPNSIRFPWILDKWDDEWKI